jgi:hypothetical protein
VTLNPTRDGVEPRCPNRFNVQHDAAIERAKSIVKYLRVERGWPNPVALVDSGNGAYVIYSIDQPRTYGRSLQTWTPSSACTEAALNRRVAGKAVRNTFLPSGLRLVSYGSSADIGLGDQEANLGDMAWRFRYSACSAIGEYHAI